MINRLFDDIDSIIFDIDGTLYDIDDVIKDVYNSQVSYYQQKTGLGKEEINKLFLENAILSYRSDKAKSATEFFGNKGFDLVEWGSYKNKHFSVASIEIEKAIKSEDINLIAERHILFAVTSNTLVNAKKVLDKIHIDESLFTEIITGDSIRDLKPFSKKKVFDYLIKKYSLENERVLSVGDRYDTDIKPILEMGGKGLILYKPAGLRMFLNATNIDANGGNNHYRYYEKSEL